MRLIAIDLDGTLEDSRDDMVAAARRVRAALALPERPDARLRPYVNAGMDELYRACFDDFLAAADGGEDRVARVRTAYERDYLEHVADATRLYDGIAEVLPELAALGSLACVTNKPERISRRLLEALGVSRWFTTVVGGDSCAHAKPHPIMLETAAARCNFERARAQAFMIGDTAGDIQLARAYGARAIWCAWGYSPSVAQSPDFEAKSPADLPRILVG